MTWIAAITAGLAAGTLIFAGMWTLGSALTRLAPKHARRGGRHHKKAVPGTVQESLWRTGKSVPPIIQIPDGAVTANKIIGPLIKQTINERKKQP